MDFWQILKCKMVLWSKCIYWIHILLTLQKKKANYPRIYSLVIRKIRQQFDAADGLPTDKRGLAFWLSVKFYWWIASVKIIYQHCCWRRGRQHGGVAGVHWPAKNVCRLSIGNCQSSWWRTPLSANIPDREQWWKKDLLSEYS